MSRNFLVGKTCLIERFSSCEHYKNADGAVRLVSGVYGQGAWTNKTGSVHRWS